jgi:hypothetical protein
MINKTTHLWIIMALLSLIFVACQSPVEETPLPEAAALDIAYPAEDEIIPQDPIEMDAAYPITEEDLQLLHRTWDLSVYSEDGIVQTPLVKTLRFGADGSYEMITESGTSRGNWTASLFAIESTLILDDDSGETLTFTIVDLEEALLNLRSWRENVQIEEQFSPAD